MVSVPENETQIQENEQQIQTQNQNEEHYKLVNRVINYPTVNTLWETAKDYYATAKDSSSLIKKGCDMVESNIDSTMKYVVQPVMDNQMVKKISEPVLTSVDNFGCKQLDRLEKLSETCQPTVTALKEKASSIVETSSKSIEPIDQYLKNSYLATPLKIAVGVTENLCDKYIPENDDKAEEEKETDEQTEKKTPGPISRGTKVAKRLQKEALSKLGNLSLRDLDTKNSFVHVVDLIQYAAKNLDSGVESSKRIIGEGINKGVEKSYETVHLVNKTFVDGPKAFVDNNINTAERREQLHHLTHEAMVALTTAVEVISRQIPQPIANTSVALYDKTKFIALRIEEANITLFNAIAAKSVEKLRETSDMISAALKNSDSLPVAILETAKSNITGILESLLGAKD